MRDNEGSEFFNVKGLCERTKYIHLGYGVIISEDSRKLVSSIQYVKFKKNGEVYFELIN